MKNSDPCKICLVRPMCMEGCYSKYHYYRYKLRKMVLINSLISSMGWKSGLLLYFILIILDLNLYLSALISVATMSSCGIFLKILVVNPRITNLKKIVELILIGESND